MKRDSSSDSSGRFSFLVAPYSNLTCHRWESSHLPLVTAYPTIRGTAAWLVGHSFIPCVSSDFVKCPDGNLCCFTGPAMKLFDTREPSFKTDVWSPTDLQLVASLQSLSLGPWPHQRQSQDLAVHLLMKASQRCGSLYLREAADSASWLRATHPWVSPCWEWNGWLRFSSILYSTSKEFSSHEGTLSCVLCFSMLILWKSLVALTLSVIHSNFHFHLDQSLK